MSITELFSFSIQRYLAAGMLILVLVLKDFFQVLVLVLVLGGQVLVLILVLGGQVQEVLVLVLGVRSLSLSWSLWSSLCPCP